MAGVASCTSASTGGAMKQSPEEGAGAVMGSTSENNDLDKYNQYERINDTDLGEDNRFQYVLAAATSVACKMNEETLTYLNQGQSYEIKLKKLGELSAFRGKVVKSVVRVCFHERRLQYTEREQLLAWQQSRPGDRILEVDLPLSYGLFDVYQDPTQLNLVEFCWDPIKEVGVYIRVNCISTEFTPKKHGGEKGVPFRIQVETYSQASESQPQRRLHAGACQVKVFKLKGADRKHKQDREKIMKRPPSEFQKYQPSCHCTILTDLPLDAVYTGTMPVTMAAISAPTSVAAGSSGGGNGVTGGGGGGTSGAVVANNVVTSSGSNVLPGTSSGGINGGFIVQQEPSVPVAVSAAGMVGQESPNGAEQDSPEGRVSTFHLPSPYAHTHSQTDVGPVKHLFLQSDTSAPDTALWLQSNRFAAYCRTFANFSGADLLRLSRDDLVQICGLPDGIRLYNALHSKAAEPLLTLYICQESDQVFHALYLEQAIYSELVGKLAQLLAVRTVQVRDVFVQGPSGIHVVITDEVVRNLRNESMFCLHVLSDPSTETFRLLLKNVGR